MRALLVAAAVYDAQTARQYAQLAMAAYSTDASLAAWTCSPCAGLAVTDVKVCHGTTTRAFVGRWDGQCVVSFEGTRNLPSAIRDLNILEKSTNWAVCGECRVHGGFLHEYTSLATCVAKRLEAVCPGEPLRVAGHSLGAATSALAMLDLAQQGWAIAEAYTFGMPRTGDAVFATAFQAKFPSNFYRVTHRRDPVVHVPPKRIIVDWHYAHVEPEVYYDSDGTEGGVACTTDGDHACSGQWWDVPLDMVHLADHLLYMGIECPWHPLVTPVVV